MYFNKIKSLLQEGARKKHSDKFIKDFKESLKKIELIYGREAFEITKELIKTVEKHAKILRNFRNTKEGRTPKLNLLDPTKAKMTPDEYKQENDQRKIEFKNKKAKIAEQIKILYQNKLNDLYQIYKKITVFPIPDQNCQLDYTNENDKVGDDTIIINMGPATICDAAIAGKCDLYLTGNCYAQNNEISRPLSFLKRFREKLQWKGISADTMATQIASMIKSKPKHKGIKYVRFNESGNFSSPKDVKKLFTIVKETNRILAKDGLGPITFYTYTHRDDLFQNITTPENLVIQGSGTRGAERKPFFVDNCFHAADYDIMVNLVEDGSFLNSRENKDKIFEALGISDGPSDAQIVFCRGACADCNYCKTKKKKLILVIIHGIGSTLQGKTIAMTKMLKDGIKSSLFDITALTIPNDTTNTGVVSPNLSDKQAFLNKAIRDILSTNYYNANNIIVYLSEFCKVSKKQRTPLLDPSFLEIFYYKLLDFVRNNNLLSVFSVLYDDETRKRVTKPDEIKNYFNKLTQKINQSNAEKLIKYEKEDNKAEIDQNKEDENEEEGSETTPTEENEKEGNDKSFVNSSVEYPDEVLENFSKNGILLIEGKKGIADAGISSANEVSLANFALSGRLKGIRGFVPEDKFMQLLKNENEDENVPNIQKESKRKDVDALSESYIRFFKSID